MLRVIMLSLWKCDVNGRALYEYLRFTQELSRHD